jgi:hypothetical protein
VEHEIDQIMRGATGWTKMGPAAAILRAQFPSASNLNETIGSLGWQRFTL